MKVRSEVGIVSTSTSIWVEYSFNISVWKKWSNQHQNWSAVAFQRGVFHLWSLRPLLTTTRSAFINSWLPGSWTRRQMACWIGPRYSNTPVARMGPLSGFSLKMVNTSEIGPRCVSAHKQSIPERTWDEATTTQAPVRSRSAATFKGVAPKFLPV